MIPRDVPHGYPFSEARPDPRRLTEKVSSKLSLWFVQHELPGNLQARAAPERIA